MLISEFLNYFVTTLIRVRQRLLPLFPIRICRLFTHDVLAEITAVTVFRLTSAGAYVAALRRCDLGMFAAELMSNAVGSTQDRINDLREMPIANAEPREPAALAKVTE